MRLLNYDKHDLHVRIGSTSDVVFTARAVVDLVRGVGYGTYTTRSPGGGPALTRGLVAWNATRLEVASSRSDTTARRHWTKTTMTTTSVLDLTLLLALQLGSDRPDNPTLLQQSGARLLGTEGSGAETTWVISGPGESTAAGEGASSSQTASAGSASSRTTYWIRRDGRLRRFEADLGTRAPSSIVVGGSRDRPARIPRAVLRSLGSSS